MADLVGAERGGNGGDQTLANPKDKGLVGDTSQIERVAQYLKALAATGVEVKRDKASQRTNLKGKGEVLAGVAPLEHR